MGTYFEYGVSIHEKEAEIEQQDAWKTFVTSLNFI